MCVSLLSKDTGHLGLAMISLSLKCSPPQDNSCLSALSLNSLLFPDKPKHTVTIKKLFISNRYKVHLNDMVVNI